MASNLKIFVATHLMTGNTGIQLAVAYILDYYYGPRIIQLGDCTTHNQLILDETWSLLYDFLGRDLPPRFSRLMISDIYMAGYFQDSVPLVKHRHMILERFHNDTTVISQGGYTLKEFATAPPPITLDPDDLVIHIRMGDFAREGLLIDPAPQLAIIRKEIRSRLIIVCAKPKTEGEQNYLKFFEEFHPILQHGTELEDFSVLRCASRIIVSNSTFSWLAAFMGGAKQRWIAVSDELGKISDSDIMYNVTRGYKLEDLIPVEPFLPVTGEFLQSLCDYSITSKDITKRFENPVDYAHPPERQCFIEDTWPPAVFEATSLFIFPEGPITKNVFKHTWPNLRLIVFHNSDYEIDYDLVIPFLDANPKVHCWAQNAFWHPRIRVVPIGEENRRWRGGNAIWEPTVTVSRATERDIGVLVPYWNNTNPVRGIWFDQASERRDVHILPRLQKRDYLDYVEQARALVCPPGNGIDTHRHWDALRHGAWAVVQNNGHTQALLKTYPSLHLIPVDDMRSPIVVPEGLPPFHPLMLRPFWRTLFASYII
jgi:hypothetical protein